MLKRFIPLWLPSLLAAFLFLTNGRAETFSIGGQDFILDGKPLLIRCGEMHFARIPREYWAQRLRMAHAMGLNTVCAYLFWNIHEPTPGHFDFSGMADAAEFCRLAQVEGLHVILRPGPYSCAEWDLGGLPWWLLKIPGVKLRTEDPRYLAACKSYLTEVGRHLAPLQVTHGGPIIMVQVENEYGSFGTNRNYLGDIRDDLKAAGFVVPLFTCDGPKELTNDVRDDIFSVVNVGAKPQKALDTLRKVRPSGPLMIGEYYPGWFDSWGEKHHTGATSNLVQDIGWMLSNNISFSMYMVHGGTSFGFEAGANEYPPFWPQATSYDYDAPVSEAGWATPKFKALRELFLAHLPAGEVLPEIPPVADMIKIPTNRFVHSASLFDNLPMPTNAVNPIAMEMLDMPHGALLCRTTLPAGPAARLRFNELHDYGYVFIDGRKIGEVDRRLKENSIRIPARATNGTLDVLVDTFGHVNYGKHLGDFKGITKDVRVETSEGTNKLQNWQLFPFPFNDEDLGKLNFQPGNVSPPAFYRTEFSLKKTGDTFLDLHEWTKGMVWVNGHNLGRYWYVGPQQTLYCPGCWLKTGSNEIVVLEFTGTRHYAINGRTEPVLNQNQ